MDPNTLDVIHANHPETHTLEFKQRVCEIMGMGFNQMVAEKAALRNSDLATAVEWVIVHQNDDNIDDPLPPPAASATLVLGSNKEVSPSLQGLTTPATSAPVQSRHGDYSEEIRRARDAEQLRLANLAKKQKEDEKRARELALERAKEDRTERNAKYAKQAPAASPASTAAAAPATGEVVVQIRLTDGSALRSTFPASATLADVAAYVAAHRKDGSGGFDLVTSLPRKIYEPPMFASTSMADAGLVPNGTLNLKPREGESAPAPAPTPAVEPVQAQPVTRYGRAAGGVKAAPLAVPGANPMGPLVRRGGEAYRDNPNYGPGAGGRRRGPGGGAGGGHVLGGTPRDEEPEPEAAPEPAPRAMGGTYTLGGTGEAPAPHVPPQRGRFGAPVPAAPADDEMEVDDGKEEPYDDEPEDEPYDEDAHHDDRDDSGGEEEPPEEDEDDGEEMAMPRRRGGGRMGRGEGDPMAEMMRAMQGGRMPPELAAQFGRGAAGRLRAERWGQAHQGPREAFAGEGRVLEEEHNEPFREPTQADVQRAENWVEYRERVDRLKALCKGAPAATLSKEVPTLKTLALNFVCNNYKLFQNVRVLPPDLLQTLLTMLMKQKKLDRSTIKGFDGSSLTEYVLDGYENTTNEVLTGILRNLHLAKLSCKGCVHITDAVFKDMQYLEQLRYLDFAQCRVTDAGLRTITQVPHLRVLRLDHCPVTAVGLTSLARMTSLVELSVRGTPLDSDSVARLAALTALATLDISNTKVGDPGLQSLTQLPSLTTLSMRVCPVTNAGMGALAGLRGLVALDLGGTNVTDTGMALLSGLTALTSLGLPTPRGITDATLATLAPHLGRLTTLDLTDAVGVTDKGARALSALTNLTNLSLANTRITDIGMAHLTALNRLAVLDLERMKGITHLGLQNLAALDQLATLSLALTPVNDGALEVLCGLAGLTSLNLARTRITDEGAEILGRCVHLRQLNLVGTQVTTEAFACLSPLQHLEILAGVPLA